MTWDDNFAIAEKYYKEHGNLSVSPGEKVDGVNLYAWLTYQRRRYRRREEQPRDDYIVPLTDEQVGRLESIGMLWESRDYAWERGFAAAKKFYTEHGHLEVPKHYEVDGINLSHWIWAQRRIVNGTIGENSRKLTEEQKRRLEEIGMDWAPKAKGFHYYYNQAKKFYEEHGHTDFPNGEIYINGELLPESGESLNAWKSDLDKPKGKWQHSAFEVHRRELCEIDINPAGWKPSWERFYDAAEQYYQKYGNLLIPYNYYTEDGTALGKWISRQRMRKKRTWGSPMSEEEIERLEKIGMIWEPPSGPHRTEFRIKTPAEEEMPDCGAPETDTVETTEEELPALGVRRRTGPRR